MIGVSLIFAMSTALPELLVPRFGIYAGAALGHRAAVSIGVNPHYGGVERRIEPHLLDFEGDLYGKRLVVELWERLRDEQVFASEQELVDQIARDVEAARRAPRPERRREELDDADDRLRLAGQRRHEVDPVVQQVHGVPGFAETYLSDGAPLAIAGRLRQERLAETLEHLGRAGLDDFYTGDLARSMSRDLEAVGSPIRLADLESHRSEAVPPLSLEVAGHRLYNMPPPTQGLASLLVLALYAPRQAASADSFDFVHRLVECTKAAFRVRDRHVSDPAWMAESAESFLTDESLVRLGAGISHDRAAPWPHESAPGDTVWLGAADRSGLCVSYIQSLYWEFGSGVILPGSGVTWQNRGASFSLEESHPNRLEPRRLPFHTIQPALAQLADGRMMVYGTMGGEGQPQTQAAIFARHVMHGVPLQAAVTAPRWLLGRTWGSTVTNLRMESRFDGNVVDPEIEDRIPGRIARGHEQSHAAAIVERHIGETVHGDQAQRAFEPPRCPLDITHFPCDLADRPEPQG